MSDNRKYRRPQVGDENVRLGQFFNAYDSSFIEMNMFCEPPTPNCSDANASELKVITSQQTEEMN